MKRRIPGIYFQPVATPTLQVGNPSTQTVSRQIQTTGPSPQEPIQSFVEQSGKATQLTFTSTANAFGGLITRSIKPAPGYLRGLWLVFKATGGVNGTHTVAGQADQPYSTVQSIQLRDPFGTVVFQTDGVGLWLVNLYSAQVGAAGFQDPSNDADWSAMSIGSSGTGNFSFALFLPLEYDPDTGYCSLPAMNSAAEMNLQIQLGTSASVYSTAPGTLPTIELDVYQDYWVLPNNAPTLAPPDDGSSHQWTQANGQNNIGSGSNVRVELPDVGTFIDTLICVFRDVNSVRTDEPFNQDLELWIDGVPRRIESPNRLFSRMKRQFGVTRPAGVAVYTFRDTVGRLVNDDNLEQLLPTTPGTLLELFSGAWGTASVSTPPWNVTTYTGKLYPLGAVPER